VRATPAPGMSLELMGSGVQLDSPNPATSDGNGIARGGIRTPWVDVPIARTSGLGGEESIMSAIFGSGELFDANTIQRLYPGGSAQYLESFTASLDAAIGAGFILPADRAEILQLAAATYPGEPG